VSQEQIFNKISGLIAGAEFVVFDISYPERPNVFLELGCAFALSKRCYIVCRSGTPIPSDLAGLDRIEYESYAKLAAHLRKFVVPREAEIANKILELRRIRYRDEDLCDEDGLLKSAVSHHLGIYLRHKFGSEVADPDASTGRAWMADLSFARNHFVYGPYERLSSAGSYRVVFKLKVSQNAYAPHPELKLDVFGGAHSERHLYAAEFSKAGVYQFFGLDFEYVSGEPVEYRVYNIGQTGRVWVDYIAVTKAQGTI